MKIVFQKKQLSKFSEANLSLEKEYHLVAQNVTRDTTGIRQPDEFRKRKKNNRSILKD